MMPLSGLHMPREVASNVIALLHVIGRGMTEATSNVMLLIAYDRKRNDRSGQQRHGLDCM